MKSKTRSSPRERLALGVVFAGAAVFEIVALFSVERTIRYVRLSIAGFALLILGNALVAVFGSRRGQRPDALQPLSAFIFAIWLGLEVGRHHDIASPAVLTAVIVVFFLAPIPLLGVLVQRSRDEFQRSIVAQSAVVSLAAFLVGGLSYAILARLYHFPNPSLIVVVPALAALWGCAAIVLRLMRS